MQNLEVDRPDFNEIVIYTTNQFRDVFGGLVFKYDLPAKLFFASGDAFYPFVFFGNFSFVYNDGVFEIDNLTLKSIYAEENSVLNAFNLLAKNCPKTPLLCDQPFLQKLLLNDSVVVWEQDGDYGLIGSDQGILSVLCPSGWEKDLRKDLKERLG